MKIFFENHFQPCEIRIYGWGLQKNGGLQGLTLKSLLIFWDKEDGEDIRTNIIDK